MPKSADKTNNTSYIVEYDDMNTENDDDEDDEDISDNEYNHETNNKINPTLPSLTQIFIVSYLMGKRTFVLSRTGTKKFHNKIRQFQELSHIDKPQDINYGSRMGKSAEILSKLSGLVEILKISTEILK
jgi:hypothetical protein